MGIIPYTNISSPLSDRMHIRERYLVIVKSTIKLHYLSNPIQMFTLSYTNVLVVLV